MPLDGRTVIPAADIREELQRIVSSRVFARAERMKRFLEYTVEQSFRGEASAIKEYAIALAVYDKPDSFDSRIDPIVRVEASRLRAKLREYYDKEGSNDPIIISLRNKGYSVIYKKRKLSAPESPPLRGRRFENPPASEAEYLYLKGRHYWNRRQPEALNEAADCFKSAMKRNPRYALAHAGLADCYASQAWLEIDQPERLWPLAEASAREALSLESSLAQAKTTLACKQALCDWNWAGAESLFRSSIESSTRYATARHWYSIFCLAPQRRLDAALSEISRACELDPVSAMMGTHLGLVLYFRRQYQEAIEQYERSIELDPAFHLAYWHMAFALIQLSRFEAALDAVKRASLLGRSSQATETAFGCIYAHMGRKDDAVAALNNLKVLQDRIYVSPVSFALVHTALGESEIAFRWLDKARDGRACRLAHLKVEPAFDNIKTAPQLTAILSSMNLL